MPRTTAPDTRGGGAASSGLGRKRSLVARGTSAKNEVVRQTRAALGEITNAAAKGHKDGCVGPMGKKGNSNSLKSQVKKGLTSIVVTASRRRSSQTATQAKQQKLVTSTSSSRQARGGSPPLHLQSSFDSNGSNSLPSSQEEESVQRLREKLAAEQLDLSKLSDESDESYHSASEGNDHEAKNHRYNPPARVVPPPGVKDFDLENLDDPATCSEYAADIFQYYKDREAQFLVRDYLGEQPEITEMMRSILVDWLVEVQESFELNHETLYTSIKLMDTFMARRKVSKEQLQLVGAVAALIACKTDERIPPSLDDFVYVCDDAYTRKDIVRKELEVMEVVGYDVGYPLSYRFLRRFGRVCRINMPDLTFARYILELSLMEYSLCVGVSESLLAAAVLVLALKVKSTKGWSEAFKFYAGFSLRELRPLAQKLIKMLARPQNQHLKTIRQKYSHRVFYSVATLKIPTSLPCWDCFECVERCESPATDESDNSDT